MKVVVITMPERAKWSDPAELRDVSLATLAKIAHRDWSGLGNGVNFAAKPYLGAMETLNDIGEDYGADSGDSIVAYFLANANTWRGPVARAVKAELKRRLKEVYA